MTAAKASAPVPANGVNFVDENNARRMLLGLVEHVPDAGRADTNEHFDKIRT